MSQRIAWPGGKTHTSYVSTVWEPCESRGEHFPCCYPTGWGASPDHQTRCGRWTRWGRGHCVWNPGNWLGCPLVPPRPLITVATQEMGSAEDSDPFGMKDGVTVSHGELDPAGGSAEDEGSTGWVAEGRGCGLPSSWSEGWGAGRLSSGSSCDVSARSSHMFLPLFPLSPSDFEQVSLETDSQLHL